MRSVINNTINYIINHPIICNTTSPTNQNTTVTGEVDHVKKNISRCLVKSEQLVDDVTNIAKQNDMIRNDMRDLKLLCDYLSSKNDETQR